MYLNGKVRVYIDRFQYAIADGCTVSNGAGHKITLIMNVTFEHTTVVYDDKIADVLVGFVNHIPVLDMIPFDFCQFTLRMDKLYHLLNETVSIR